jgi:RNA polymerase sigma factor for flagellar operon FliA
MRDLALYVDSQIRTDYSQILTQYSSLVKQVANHLAARLPSNIELDDLIQVGLIGLLEAHQNFDRQKNVQFEAFAKIRIRGAMIDEVRRVSNLPRSVMKSIRDVNQARNELEQALGRAVSEHEIADHMGLSIHELQSQQHKNHALQTTSLDYITENNHSVEPLFNGLTIIESLDKEILSQELIKAIDQLSEREQLIFSLYYSDELNLKEIAEVLGLTESRVCQIQKASMAQLKIILRDFL